MEEILTGRRVTLRHPRRDELEYIRYLWRDSKTMKEVGGPIEFSAEKILKWYSNYIKPGKSSNCYFLIYDEDSTPIGEVSYRGWSSSKKEANLNIKIESKYRGRGYAGEALNSFLEFFFVTAGGEKLIDDLNPKNLGAKYFLEKFGFVEQAGSEDPRIMILKRKVYLEMAQEATGGDTAHRYSRP